MNEARSVRAEEFVEIGRNVALRSILDDTICVLGGLSRRIVDTVKSAQASGGNGTVAGGRTTSIMLRESAQGRTEFRVDVTTITWVKGRRGTITLILADMNVKVGRRSNEVDMVLDRSGDGVRSASNVRCSGRTMLVDFISSAD